MTEPWKKPGFTGTRYQNFFRRVAYPFARIISQTSISPNTLTVFAIFLYSIPAYLFIQPQLWQQLLGVLFLYVVSIIDRIDGQVARIQKRTSKTGEFLDGILHNIGPLAVYPFIGYSVYLSTGQQLYYTLGVVTGIAVLLHNSNYLNRLRLLGEQNTTNKLAMSARAMQYRRLMSVYSIPTKHLPEVLILTFVLGAQQWFVLAYSAYHVGNALLFSIILARFPKTKNR